MAPKPFRVKLFYLKAIANFELEKLGIEKTLEATLCTEIEKVINSTPFALRQILKLYCLFAFFLQKAGLSSDSVSEVPGISSIRKFFRTKLLQSPEVRGALNFHS